MAGTVMQSRNMERLKMRLISPNPLQRIFYRVHLANVGWQDWRSDDQEAGLDGGQIQAVQIQLL
jgi:hypothetical protein